MLDQLFSPSWYRIAKLKPRLRSHADIHRQVYRGERWYVLRDPASGRSFRFSPIAYQVIGLMDGKLTVQQIWEKAVARFGDDAPTQGDMVRLLSQLHAADVLVCDVPPDTAELFRRQAKIAQSKWKTALRSPLAVRLPLWDPEKFLSRTIRYVEPIFTLYGFLVWLAVVAAGLILAAVNWPDLTENWVDRILSIENLLFLWVAFPLIKALHELGHGYAVKHWGGEVHEMGIMLLVFMPVPYVDASSASAFREKRRRILVGAAGIMVELFLAALALFVWLHLSPGTLKSLCFNIILVGGVSTVLFNGNPLLRYDGYYILSDFLGIPNLYQRSLDYLGYVAKRYVLRLQVQPPYLGPGENFWLIFYAVASFTYRIFIYTAIILFITNRFFFIGVLLGVWAVCGLVVFPVTRRIKYLLTSPEVRPNRVPVLTAGVVGLAMLSIFLFLIPFPSWTVTEGVVWAPEESLVRAGTSGFVSQVRAKPNAMVEKGEILFTCQEPLLQGQIKVLEAQLKELELRYLTEINSLDRVQANILREEIASARAKLARERERQAELIIRSPCQGRFLAPAIQDLPGRFLRQGELVAYVLNVEKPTVRVVVPQPDADLVRQRTGRIAVRLAERPGRVIPAVLKREVPGAVEQLPSPVLGRAGGGQIATDPFDRQGLKAIERLFQFDLELGEAVPDACVGGRAYVRFDHGYVPLGFQIYRRVRQLFLRRFNV